MDEKTNLMTQWTIYFNTLDYPGKHVVRKWYISSAGLSQHDEALVVDTLEQARSVIPRGLYQMPRADEDDPVIVETWI